VADIVPETKVRLRLAPTHQDHDHGINQIAIYWALTLPFNASDIQLACGNLARSQACSNRQKFPTIPPSFDFTQRVAAPGKIRLGFVSQHFNGNAVGQWFKGFPMWLDQSKFEVYCFNFGAAPADPIGLRVAETCTMVQIDNMELPEAVNLVLWFSPQVYKHRPDVLIDIGIFGGGYMELFAMKPAPILIAMCGFSTSSGTPWYDYIVADRVSMPEPWLSFSTSEKPIYMPW
jgi:protein O-GlcNAc transferase